MVFLVPWESLRRFFISMCGFHSKNYKILWNFENLSLNKKSEYFLLPGTEFYF